jgi:type IV secretory pathway VirB4 component
VIGLDGLSQGLWRYDPWRLYAATPRELTSLGMLVLGPLGRGKSAAIKTYLARQHQLAGAHLMVLDPKGEYRALADRLGLAHVALTPGGHQRLNPLDPGPAPAGNGRGAMGRDRAAMVEALTAVAVARRLEPAESAGITAVCAALPAAATVAEVVAGLLEPARSTAAALHLDPPGAATALRPAGLALGRLVAGPLAGMLDGPTTVAIDWSGPGVVLDLSAVFTGEALGPVMVCAATWLSRLIAAGAGRRILVLDEAWALLGRAELAAWLQATVKLSRTLGVQVIVVTHRLSDLRAQAEAGSAAERQAAGLLADLETQLIFGQPASERKDAAELLGLSSSEAELVCQLPPYRALWRYRGRLAVVDHLLAADELGLVDTDGGIVER